MDELMLDDKKYVSSKKAAKLTGYARDYIGQLCREGRVTSRLVGRSWYVLESEILDHRFGDGEAPVVIAEEDPRETTRAWEAPTYVTEERHALPVAERAEAQPEIVEETIVEPEAEETVVEDDVSLDLSDEAMPIEESQPQETTVVHFDIAAPDGVELEQVVNTSPIVEDRLDVSTSEPEAEFVVEPLAETIVLNKNLVDQMPVSESHDIAETPEKRPRARRSAAIRNSVIRLTMPVIAAVFLILAIINTGFFDQYIASVSQVAAVTGYSVLIKTSK